MMLAFQYVIPFIKTRGNTVYSLSAVVRMKEHPSFSEWLEYCKKECRVAEPYSNSFNPMIPITTRSSETMR